MDIKQSLDLIWMYAWLQIKSNKLIVFYYYFKTLNPETFTNHEFDVTELTHFNEESGYLYYIATGGDSRARHVYRY